MVYFHLQNYFKQLKKLQKTVTCREGKGMSVINFNFPSLMIYCREKNWSEVKIPKMCSKNSRLVSW